MQTPADKTSKDADTSATNVISKKQTSESTSAFTNNRPQTVAQKKLQELADNSPQVNQLKAFQEMANKSSQLKQSHQVFQQKNNNSLPQSSSNSSVPVVQRLKGAPGTAEEGTEVTFTISDDFKEKHVANNSAEAVQATERRIATGKPPGIVAGTAPNNLAKLADWNKAIEDSTDLVPPENVWGGDNGFEDKRQFVNQLAKVEVAGWEAQGTKGNVVAKVTTNKKYVGGHWEVTGSEFNDEEDGDGEYKQKSGSVTMDIDHLTS